MRVGSRIVDNKESLFMMSERTVAWDGPTGTVTVAGVGGVSCGAVGRISCGEVGGVVVVVSLATTFVFKTSGFLRRPLFRCCHPRLEMARLFGCTLANDCFHLQACPS